MRKVNSDRFEAEGEERDAEKTLRYLKTLEAGLSAFCAGERTFCTSVKERGKPNRGPRIEEANGET